VADAVAAGFATLVAVMLALVEDFEAVNSPSEIVPPVADHRTATLLVPLTVALNRAVPPGEI
jgi:hypothetical protein